MKTVEYTIINELGLHARPAGILVKLAAKQACKVTISKGEKSADAKKIFGVMGLGVKCNDMISITCDGEDEEATISAITELFKEHALI